MKIFFAAMLPQIVNVRASLLIANLDERVETTIMIANIIFATDVASVDVITYLLIL